MKYSQALGESKNTMVPLKKVGWDLTLVLGLTLSSFSVACECTSWALNNQFSFNCHSLALAFFIRLISCFPYLCHIKVIKPKIRVPPLPIFSPSLVTDSPLSSSSEPFQSMFQESHCFAHFRKIAKQCQFFMIFFFIKNQSYLGNLLKNICQWGRTTFVSVTNWLVMVCKL